MRKCKKTESGEICKVEDITEDAAGLDDLTIIDETQSATSEVEVSQLELAIGDDVSKVEASTEFQYDSSDDQGEEEFELAVVSSVSPEAEVSVAEVPALPVVERFDEQNPIEIVSLEPVISIELPVVRDVKK